MIKIPKTLDVLQVNPYVYLLEEIAYLKARVQKLEEGREDEEQGTISDAVKWSGRGKDFIYKQCAAGKFPHHHTGGGQKYFVKSEVKAWKAKRFE